MDESSVPKQRLSLRGARTEKAESAEVPWPVLVVDDDPQVHTMTRVLLRDFDFQGRSFEVLSAYSAADARELLATHPDVPIMLLDVVMETDIAGLELARYIRETLGNLSLRIILRTGQPGEAPERRVMLDYDINDYRSKTELTAQKMFTAVVSALRSWQHITTIERLNTTLETRVAERTAELEEARAFAESLVELLPSPVWYKDEHGRYRLYNRAFREFFNIGPTCWHGCTGAEVLGERLPAEENDTDDMLLSGRAERMSYEMALPDITGMARSLMVSKSLVRRGGGGGGVRGVVAVATDITERKGLERELRRLATVDPLTGAFNRRYFLSAASQEMERAVRYGGSLSLLMIDIDHFKRVNDRFGHALGDEVLRKTVEVCRANLREVDIFARLGGEEFAALLPQTASVGALGLAERLRRAVAEMVVPLAGGDLRVTVSVGVAERSVETTFEHLMSRADQALYAAKETGRNRVEMAPVPAT